MENMLRHLIEHCGVEMRRIEEQLPTGLAKDMAEYHKMCAKHFAYLEMRTYMGDLLNRIINGEDDE